MSCLQIEVSVEETTKTIEIVRTAPQHKSIEVQNNLDKSIEVLHECEGSSEIEIILSPNQISLEVDKQPDLNLQIERTELPGIVEITQMCGPDASLISRVTSLENEVFGPDFVYYKIRLGLTNPILFNTHKYLQRDGVYTSDVPIELSIDSSLILVEVGFEEVSTSPRSLDIINEDDDSVIYSWVVPSGVIRESDSVSIPIPTGVPFSVSFSGGPSSWNSAIVNLLFKAEV